MTYKVQEFAKLAGVTVRTLHHYDRLGLLRPEHRSEGGYRLYTRQDLLRLERVRVLRYLGLSLREVGEIVSAAPGEEGEVAVLLRRQAVILRERRDGLTRVLRAVEAAERAMEQGGQRNGVRTEDWKLFQTILQEVAMQESTEWTKKYYSEVGQTAVEQRKAEWSPELQERVSRQWSEMFARVEAALAAGVRPESDEGRALAAEWGGLVRQFTGGDREVQKGLNAMYADQGSWPAEAKGRYAIKPELMEFIRRASAVGA